MSKNKKNTTTRRRTKAGSTVSRTASTARVTRKAADSVQRAADSICGHCYCRRSAHYVLNYADGPMVSGGVYVCPTATFIR